MIISGLARRKCPTSRQSQRPHPSRLVLTHESRRLRSWLIYNVSQNMPPELAWLLGERLAEVVKREFSWLFILSSGGSVTTEHPWRLITHDGVAASSMDDQHLFGSHTAFDASASVLRATKGKQIAGVRVAGGSSDLILAFDGDVRLEFLTLSSGYEGWRATYRDADLICLGGGVLYRNEKKG